MYSHIRFFCLLCLFMPALASAVTPITKGGAYHSLALKSDGTVVGWGYNGQGQTTIPTGLTNVIAIEAGAYHSLALKSDGTVLAWGYNGNGETDVPAGLSGVTAIAAGDYHSLALKSDGTVVGWGYSGAGAVTPPAELNGVISISAGSYHSQAVKSDGTVVAWGNNYYKQATPPKSLNLLANTTNDATYAIGNKGPAGGIVFYTDSSGFHGLEAYSADYTDSSTNARQFTWQKAIAAANSYGSGWRLPTKEETHELYIQRDIVDGLDSYTGYWSSTELDSNNAWYWWFGSTNSEYKDYQPKSNKYNVRAVRSF